MKGQVAPQAGAWVEAQGWTIGNGKRVVAPHAGAWVETTMLSLHEVCVVSLPVWERGLKHHIDTGLAVFSGRFPCGSVD